ncbi:MAG: SUF system NifU family Fe-S cluster assembly protein [Deltaproteobacteria bacterium]|nr:SUF system NifU family Fe-S cluster assembly protein [Deltaproteobacteria bacterium]MBW2363162.1 SUF system NifU family Fe-S cluster assembly protein [Deltaproteobacteria bacterium]
MSELRELYQTVILDHNNSPRNFGNVENATGRAAGHNPLCGDQIEVSVRVVDGVVKDLRFEGSGCAISTASASIMTQAVKDKPLENAFALFERFHQLVTTSSEQAIDSEALGKLAVFGGVREFPVRVKCATLPWHTLKNALEGTSDVAKTE